MLDAVKLRGIYAKIRTQIFNMIPEKWDRIYLYASFIKRIDKVESGEMFFYYYPKGVLKKNPINVYEIPNKFNIDESSYMKLVDNLYETFIELRKLFKDSKERMWSNLTISIENLKFNVEYDYENLLGSKYTSYDRHIIWKCKYLDFPVERLNKKDQEMIKQYYKEKKQGNISRYSEGLYTKRVHNVVEYNKEQDIEKIQQEEIKQDIQDNKKEQNIGEKLDKYEIYKKRQEELNKYELYEERKEELNQYELYKQKQEEKKKKETEKKENMKNQILKI